MAKSLHEDGKDILDVFVPFVLMTFYHLKKDKLKENKIKLYLKKLFDLEISGHTLKTIITRAKRTDYVIQKYNRIELTEKGKNLEKYFELERDIERENNNLLEHLDSYYREKGISFTKDEISKVLISVINSNLLSLTAYLGEEPKLNIYKNLDKKVIRYTLEYFEYLENSKPIMFSTLKKMIMGSIICTLVKKDQNILKAKIDPLSVFLDTNIVFSILGYHHPQTSILAQELFSLLKENKFNNEVILDQLFTNVLWFKNPSINSNLPLYSVISMHSNSLFIDNNVWNKFTWLLENMKEQGKLSGTDITIILFNDKIEDELINFDGDVNRINENFIEDLLKKSQQLYNEREEVFKLQQDKAERVINDNKENLLNIKNNIVQNADDKSQFWYWGSIIFAFILLTIISYVIYKQLWSSFFNWFVPILISVVISSVEIKFGLPFKKFKKKMYNFHLNRLTKKILGYSSLESINKKLEYLDAASTLDKNE